MLLFMAVNVDVVTHDRWDDLSSNTLFVWIVLWFYWCILLDISIDDLVMIILVMLLYIEIHYTDKPVTYCAQQNIS